MNVIAKLTKYGHIFVEFKCYQCSQRNVVNGTESMDILSVFAKKRSEWNRIDGRLLDREKQEWGEVC